MIAAPSDRRGVVWLAILVGAVAAWMNAGRLHDLQNADSLLPARPLSSGCGIDWTRGLGA